jgi:hypothetical protein
LQLEATHERFRLEGHRVLFVSVPIVFPPHGVGTLRAVRCVRDISREPCASSWGTPKSSAGTTGAELVSRTTFACSTGFAFTLERLSRGRKSVYQKEPDSARRAGLELRQAPALFG